MSYGFRYIGEVGVVRPKVEAFTAQLPEEGAAQLAAAKASILKTLEGMSDDQLVIVETYGSAWAGSCCHSVKVEKITLEKKSDEKIGTPPPTGGGPGDPH